MTDSEEDEEKNEEEQGEESTKLQMEEIEGPDLVGFMAEEASEE